MKTQREKALTWWNSLRGYHQNDLALDYYGVTLVVDDEIEFIWLREIPQEKLYTKEEHIANIKAFAEEFVANTDTAYKQADIDKWITQNL